MTEYLLVMVIVVAIALGVMYQFSSAFKKYLESYFGDYVACLLETGELPSLGASESNINNDTCNANFEAFSLANGRPGKGGGSRGGGRGATSNSRIANTTGRVKSSSSPGFNAERSAATSVAANINKSADAGKKAVARDSSGPDANVSLPIGRYSSNSQFSLGRKKGQEKKETEATTTVKASNSKGRNDGRKLAFDPKALKKKQVSDDKGMDFSLGDYLRYFIIAAIIIAIVVVVGGMLNQARRNQQAQ